MKFLAILKDSLREAIDCKALYVMVGLSLLVIGVVGSMSFEPMPAETVMREIVEGDSGGLNLLMMKKGIGEAEERAPGQPPKRHVGPFQLEKVQVLRGPSNSPFSEYSLIVSLRLDSKKAADAAGKDPEKHLERVRRKFANMEEWELLEVKSIQLASPPDPEKAAPDQLFVEVQTAPTEATSRAWFHEPSLFFGALPLGDSAPLGLQLFVICQVVLFIGSWVAILVSVIITAFFIPNMLRKGTLDLMLVKPMQRWAILLDKYLGGLSFIFLNTTFSVLGIWLALGLRSGIWANNFLFMVPILTFFFAVLYAVSTLFAVLTGSAVVAILMTCGAWFLFWLVGTVHVNLEAFHQMSGKPDAPAAAKVTRVIHRITPRTRDLDYLASQIILSDFLSDRFASKTQMQIHSVTWEESITVNLVFMALMLGLACWRFAVKDY